MMRWICVGAQAKPGGPKELELLKGITGAFQPGVLTALMGASGAGKTTFMDVLAGRKNSEPRPDVTVIAYPLLAMLSFRAERVYTNWASS